MLSRHYHDIFSEPRGVLHSQISGQFSDN